MTAQAAPADLSLTLIVIALVGGDALQRCVSSAARIPARRMVIARPDVVEQSAGLWPQFEWLAATESVPLRRARGLAAATTDWVALIEDTCELTQTWAAALREIAQARSGAAWSGPVMISPDMAPRFVALACTEYGEFAPDHWARLATAPTAQPSREMSRIPGLSLVYRRSALAKCALHDGVIESDLHTELARHGESLWMHPGLAVRYGAADWRNATVLARFAHGRIYGGGLASRSSVATRLLGALKCLALPCVLPLRALRGLPDRHRHRPAALGWIFAFSCAWAAGECLGLLAGRGKAVQSWT